MGAVATRTFQVRPGADLLQVYRILLGAARPLLWPAHLFLLVVPSLAGGLGEMAWPLGLLLWAAAGLVASAAHAGRAPPEVPHVPWTAWRFGLGALGVMTAAAVAPWAVAALALYGVLIVGARAAAPAER